jgi:outer membrane protein assembly factor BamD (BamD/ComL family)
MASGPSDENHQNVEPELDPARSPSTLFAAANLARRHGDIAEATTLYRLLQARFPGSEEARLSLITYARLELDTGHSTAALALFDQYLRSSRRPLEAEALVGRAHALRRLGRSAEEAAAWQAVARKYPGSAYAEQAAERLPALSSP